MIRWLVSRWHAKQRAIDIDILWPVCKEHAKDIDHARTAFAIHAFHDNAWLCLGEDEIYRRIEGMM